MNANVLSPYGLERNRPAGEMMCKQAAVKAIRCLTAAELDGMMRCTKAESVRTAPRWEMWETITPVKACLMMGDGWMDEGSAEER